MNLNWHEFKSIPNILTLARLLAIPFMAVLILQTRGQTWAGFWIFLAIWVTDIVDGYIARRFNMITSVGKVLDPLVDKIFHLTTALALYFSGRLPLWVLLLILIKDILMIVGGSLLWKRDVVVHASWPGKVTTVLFVLAFALMFHIEPTDYYLMNIVFIPAAIMAVVSFVRYANDYRPLPRS